MRRQQHVSSVFFVAFKHNTLDRLQGRSEREAPEDDSHKGPLRSAGAAQISAASMCITIRLLRQFISAADCTYLTGSTVCYGGSVTVLCVDDVRTSLEARSVTGGNVTVLYVDDVRNSQEARSVTGAGTMVAAVMNAAAFSGMAVVVVCKSCTERRKLR
jgi:hypothetical protein